MFESLPDNGNDSSEMFARCELGYNTAVFSVRFELRTDDIRPNAVPIFHHGGCGLVTRAFNS